MDKFDEIKVALLNTKREGIKNLVGYLEVGGFKTSPASSRYHSNFEGGLLEHTYNVWKCAEKIALSCLNAGEAEVFLIASVCHDLSKIGRYKWGTRNRKSEKTGLWEKYGVWEIDENQTGVLPLGHPYASIEIAERYIKLKDIEKIMIANHMGMIGVGYTQMQEIAEAFTRHPEAVILHLADMQATYILEEVKK